MILTHVGLATQIAFDEFVWQEFGSAAPHHRRPQQRQIYDPRHRTIHGILELPSGGSLNSLHQTSLEWSA